MGTKMLQRRGTAADWASINPVLGEGELGFELDTGILKIGDGVTHWNDLGDFNGLDGDVGPAGPPGSSGDSSWTAATLTSPWTAYSTFLNRFRKDGSGFVHLEGQVTGATSTTSNVLTLPSGYRPSHDMYVPAIKSDFSGALLFIQSSGVCEIIMANLTVTNVFFSCSFFGV